MLLTWREFLEIFTKGFFCLNTVIPEKHRRAFYLAVFLLPSDFYAYSLSVETINSTLVEGFAGVFGFVCLFFLMKALGMCVYLLMTKGYLVNTVILGELQDTQQLIGAFL